jgi:hypothetical protein
LTRTPALKNLEALKRKIEKKISILNNQGKEDLSKFYDRSKMIMLSIKGKMDERFFEELLII